MRVSTTLTRDQEARLIEALELIVEAESIPAAASPRPTSPWRRPLVVPALAFVAVLAVFLPFGLAGNEVTEHSDTTGSTQQSPATTVPGAPDPSAGTVGDASRVEGATVFSDLTIAGETFYTVEVGEVDQVLSSLDEGRSWEPVLRAEPGDAEGLYAAGRLVVQVVEDDDPVRDSMGPGSAVSESPRVLVYDPASGSSSETTLPRPQDPEMTGLPMNGSSGCALAGYQSWVRAEGVAVGDRLLVVGYHQLVGELSSGEVVCDSQAYRHLAWVSDDGGITWGIHDIPAVVSVVWTGERFVGWSPSDESGARSLLTSDDGVAWTTAATTPPTGQGLIPVGPPQLVASGERVIGLVELHVWATEIPETVTDPEDLREALGMDTDPNASPAETLGRLGIDLPLDDDEREIIERFNGTTTAVGAIIVTSEDGGATWAIEDTDQAIAGVTIAGDLYVALSAVADVPSALLSSTSGADWNRLADLPVPGAGATLAATNETIFFADATNGELWTLPLRG